MLLSKPDQWCLVSQDHMALTFKCPPKWGESERESNFILCYLFLPNILTLIFSQRGVLRLDEYHSINTVCDKFVFFPPHLFLKGRFNLFFIFSFSIHPSSSAVKEVSSWSQINLTKQITCEFDWTLLQTM